MALSADCPGQGGSALLVTLILLVILTVIGIAGMGSAILQERMAGNVQDSAQVFQATESALRLCEAYVRGGSSATGDADMAEFTAFERGGELSDPARAEVFSPDFGDNPLTAKGSTEYQLRCLVEIGGHVDPPGGSVRRGVSPPGGFKDIYRITAAGVRVPAGETATQRPTVLLQSDFVP